MAIPALLQLALELSAQHGPVFPCREDKSPLTPRGFYDATSDPAEIGKMFANPYAALIGLRTGMGIVVLDLDKVSGSQPDGITWFAKNKDRMPVTKINKTKGGGLHCYYRTSKPIPCSASKVAPHVDIRGVGGYVIAGGEGYETKKNQELAAFPIWLEELLENKTSPSTKALSAIPRNFSAFQEPGQWHDNVRDEVASLIARGVDKSTIMAMVPKWQLPGYTREKTFKEVEVFVDSALSKGFAPRQAGFSNPFKSRKMHENLASATNPVSTDKLGKENSQPEYRFLTPPELTRLPQPEWLVKRLLPASGIATIYGPSKSGKTFLVLALLACIALGDMFFGRRVRQSNVVYVCLEGAQGLANRMRAYEKHHRVTLPEDGFRVVTEGVQLFRSDITRFAAAINAEKLDGGVIVIDTLAQAAIGADENSSVDMGIIIANARRLQEMTGGLVLLVHHVGKDASRGQRGHSSLLGALDASIEVKNPSTGRKWRADKVKDGAAGEEMDFRLEVMNLGSDQDGDSITSCVAVSDSFRSPPKPVLRGPNQRAVWDGLITQYRIGDVVPTSSIRQHAEATLESNHRPTARAVEVIDKLLEKGYLKRTDEGYEFL